MSQLLNAVPGRRKSLFQNAVAGHWTPYKPYGKPREIGARSAPRKNEDSEDFTIPYENVRKPNEN